MFVAATSACPRPAIITAMVTICGPPGLWPITQGAGWGRAAVVALVGKVGRHAGMGAACQQGAVRPLSRNGAS